ncbi:MAG TPA: hypothetical protein VN372_04795 [Methanospirillum sp.]|nr:hypothetical protein [Methanospirillum sp.]
MKCLALIVNTSKDAKMSQLPVMVLQLLNPANPYVDGVDLLIAAD